MGIGFETVLRIKYSMDKQKVQTTATGITLAGTDHLWSAQEQHETSSTGDAPTGQVKLVVLEDEGSVQGVAEGTVIR